MYYKRSSPIYAYESRLIVGEGCIDVSNDKCWHDWVPANFNVKDLFKKYSVQILALSWQEEWTEAATMIKQGMELCIQETHLEA